MSDGVARGLGTAIRELAAVATYSALGHWWRSRSWDPSALDVDLRGAVCVVTGASSGLGFGAARALARRGATIVLVSRHPGRAEAARRSIAAEAPAPDRVTVELCDVASIASVRSLAARLLDRFARLDVLVNNAGVLLDARELSPEGHERTFATNVLGGFLLARLLLPALLAAAPSRVVHVGSAAAFLERLDVDALVSAGGRYVAERAYARSKRALAELNELWAERLDPRAVTSNLVHPGLAATPGVLRTFPRYHRVLAPILRDLDQGADTLVWLAVSRAAAAETGKLWFDREARPSHVVPWTRTDRAERERLWASCSSLCGLPSAIPPA